MATSLSCNLARPFPSRPGAQLSDFGLVKMVVEDGGGGGGGGGVVGRDARTGTVTHMAPELIGATEATKMDASVGECRRGGGGGGGVGIGFGGLWCWSCRWRWVRPRGTDGCPRRVPA